MTVNPNINNIQYRSLLLLSLQSAISLPPYISSKFEGAYIVICYIKDEVASFHKPALYIRNITARLILLFNFNANLKILFSFCPPPPFSVT